MTEIEERLEFRKTLLEDSKDEDGFISQSKLLYEIMPSLLDAKLVDSEEYNESYHKSEKENTKLNAYLVNNSGERLQLFIIDETYIEEGIKDEKLYVSQKVEYDKQFKRVERLVTQSFKGELFDSLQESSRAKVLASQLESIEGFEEFDTIEIFLISLSVTVSLRAKTIQLNKMYFKEHEVERSMIQNKQKKKKKILFLRKVIDLNFLFDVLVSQGHRETLTINFKKTFNYSIEAIKAADEEKEREREREKEKERESERER